MPWVRGESSNFYLDKAKHEICSCALSVRSYLVSILLTDPCSQAYKLNITLGWLTSFSVTANLFPAWHTPSESPETETVYELIASLAALRLQTTLRMLCATRWKPGNNRAYCSIRMQILQLCTDENILNTSNQKREENIFCSFLFMDLKTSCFTEHTLPLLLFQDSEEGRRDRKGGRQRSRSRSRSRDRDHKHSKSRVKHGKEGHDKGHRDRSRSRSPKRSKDKEKSRYRWGRTEDEWDIYVFGPQPLNCDHHEMSEYSSS